MQSKFEQLLNIPTKAMLRWVRKWEHHLAAALAKGQFKMTKDGIVVFDDVKLASSFFYPVRAGSNELAFAPNLVVDQGLMKNLGVMFKGEAALPNFYLAMGSGATAPSAGLTAANVASTLSEITSLTEGYSNATRPAWTPGTPVANVLNNYASEAVFNIVATTTITATCAFMISNNTRGGTTGTLWSAAAFPTDRTLHDGEPFGMGYQTTLTGV